MARNSAKPSQGLGWCCVAEIASLERGGIRNERRYKQLVDFRGLRYGAMTPTDVDGVLEYKDKLFILLELKHTSAPPMKDGQRMALERMCIHLTKQRATILLLAVHDRAPEQLIDAAAAIVHSKYFFYQWRQPEQIETVREATDAFIEKYGTPGQ